MILADTSVWVDHFQTANSRLQQLLQDLTVLTHPFVIGEIACGNLRQREEILDGIRKLPAASSADHDEVLQLLSQRRLWGKGLGWIDLHLLASALITGCRLWTLDRRLNEAAGEMNLRYW